MEKTRELIILFENLIEKNGKRKVKKRFTLLLDSMNPQMMMM